MLIPPFAAAARAYITSGFASGLLLFAGCAGFVPEVAAPAADPSAGGTTAPPRSVLGTDEVTRKTQQLLAASGATRLEGLKPMKHDMSMDGMDHGGMKEMTSSPGADHSKMPGMQRQPRAGAPAGEHQHEGMKGMDHSGMHGMEHSKMPGMHKPPEPRAPEKSQPKGIEGVDHSKMHGPEHGGEAPKRVQPEQPAGISTDHGAHSNHGGKHATPESRP